MTRDIDALKAGLRAAPAPPPKAKAAALTRALESFDDSALASQGSAPAPRPTADRPRTAGGLSGVQAMLNALKLKPMLAAGSSAAALAVGLFVFLPQSDPAMDRPVPSATPTAPTPTMTELAHSPPAASPPAPVAPPEAMMTRKLAPDLHSAVPEMTLDAPMVEPSITASVPAEVQGTQEVYANNTASPVQVTALNPVSTFSVDVDTASYAVVRSSLMGGYLPDPDAVRVEEMINYFPYTLPAPAVGEPPFRPHVTVMPTPWNAQTRLVHIALQGRLPEVVSRPPLNLVLLIDTSGSMDDPAKLPLLKQSLGLMLADLRPEDQVAIVAYAGSAGEVLPPTAASERAAILSALDRLSAGGATAGAEGLALAYRVAQGMTAAGEVSRILLATDGDFNLGVDDPEGLAAYVARKRATGIYLSVLGFGRGNLDDATMQALAQNGNGMAAYIDTLQEARKVLVDQLTGVLFPIADDVKIQVEWNPAQVAEYRLIGYETRSLRREDFGNDAVDAGEIGAGHSVTALYEITAPGSPALRNEPLRYSEAAAAETTPIGAMGDELGFLRLRYKAPGEKVSALIEVPITADETDPEMAAEVRFATAIAGFGQLLRGSVYLGDWGWDQAIALAGENRGDDPFGYRAEAINLMRLAQTLSR